MARQRTFGQKLGAGFALTILLSVAIGVVAVYALRNVVASKDHVITVDAQLVQDAESMRSSLERKGGAVRGFLLTRDERFLGNMREARGEFYGIARPTPQTGSCRGDAFDRRDREARGGSPKGVRTRDRGAAH